MSIRVGGAVPFRGGGKQREAVRGWKGRHLGAGRVVVGVNGKAQCHGN